MSEQEKNRLDVSLGIKWPEGELPAQVMDQIIQGSQERSLRRIVAGVILQEGEQLWMLYKPFSGKTPGGFRSATDIAINDGYDKVGRSVIVASNYYDDRMAVVQAQVRPTEILSTFKRAPSDNLSSLRVLRVDLTREMNKAIESLIIDPMGIDWLKRWLKIKENVWSKEDPGVIGFKRGIERYQYIYNQVVVLGARPDIIEDKGKWITALVGRWMENIQRTLSPRFLV